MQLFKTIKLTAAATALMLIAPFSFAATHTQEVVNPASMQRVIGQLQTQIQQVANSVPKELARQQANTQKAITDLQKQTQAQFAHLQAELVKLQAQVQKEIAEVQKEVQQEAQIK